MVTNIWNCNVVIVPCITVNVLPVNLCISHAFIHSFILHFLLSDQYLHITVHAVVSCRSCGGGVVIKIPTMAKSFKILDPRQRPETPSTSESSSPIDWTKCILCQETSKEPLRCPADSKRTDIDIGTLYDNLAGNLIRFKELQSSR